MKKFLISFLSQNRIAGGALVLAATQFAASLCGFFRDQAFSIMFPLDKDPLGVASVYIAAFRPSDLLFQITVMSSLSVVVVPFLASHLAHDRREEMNRITSSVLLVFGAGFGIIALVLAIFFDRIAPSLVQFQGPQLILYIRFARLALLSNFLFVFGNTVGQYLIAVQKYWVYGLTPIIWALGTITGIYVLSPLIGPMGPITGMLGGTIIYVIYRTWGAVKSGLRWELPKGILHHELREMGWLIIPRMVALGALQLQLLVIDNMGSGLGRNIVALNNFASNFESVIPGIVGIAIAQSSFSLLSQAMAKKDFDRYWLYIRKGSIYNLSIAIPGAIALILASPIAIWLLRLETGVASTFTHLLLIYAIAIPFESMNHVLLRSFYAIKNTGAPAISSVLSCIAGIGTASLLLGRLGILALAAGYIAAQLVQTVFLSSFLPVAVRRKQAA